MTPTENLSTMDIIAIAVGGGGGLLLLLLIAIVICCSCHSSSSSRTSFDTVNPQGSDSGPSDPRDLQSSFAPTVGARIVNGDSIHIPASNHNLFVATAPPMYPAPPSYNEAAASKSYTYES